LFEMGLAADPIAITEPILCPTRREEHVAEPAFA
jgi:hypothetical protein